MPPPGEVHSDHNTNKGAKQAPQEVVQTLFPKQRRRSISPTVFSPAFARRAHARNRVDGRGYRPHLVCAIIGLVGMLAFDGLAEWLVMLPVVVCFVRWLATWRSMLDALSQPVSIAILAAGVWGLLALAWSGDVMRGLDELSAFRHALLVLALWSLRDHRGLLIAALAAGFGIGHVTQAAHAIGVWGDVAWLRSPRLPDRNSGWWDPVVGGTLLCGAVGLHLPAALRGRGWARWIGVAGLCAAIGGVVATGTRGAWIAAGGLLAIAVALTLWRALRGGIGRADRRKLLGVLAMGPIAVGVAALVAGPTVMGRATRGVDEVRRVFRERDFTSDTGRRLFMWVESLHALERHPWGGQGTGGLVEPARGQARRVGIDPGLVLDHAHGMWMHLAGTQGVVGLACWAAVGASGLYSAGRCRGRTRRCRDPQSRDRRPEAAIADLRIGLRVQLAQAYAMAPPWALGGLLLAGVFDTVQVNSQTAMLLFAVLGLCAMGRRAGRDSLGDQSSAAPRVNRHDPT